VSPNHPWSSRPRFQISLLFAESRAAAAAASIFSHLLGQGPAQAGQIGQVAERLRSRGFSSRVRVWQGPGHSRPRRRAWVTRTLTVAQVATRPGPSIRVCDSGYSESVAGIPGARESLRGPARRLGLALMIMIRRSDWDNNSNSDPHSG
jgi:hypothetical protein